MGEMKAGSSREGVPMASLMVLDERACVRGGGTGRAKSCLWPLVKGEPEAIARRRGAGGGCCCGVQRVSGAQWVVCQQRGMRREEKMCVSVCLQ